MTLLDGGIPRLIGVALERGGHATIADLCRATGIPQSTMTPVKRGYYPPSDEVLFHLCNEADEPFLPWAIYCHALKNEGEIADAWQSGLEDLIGRRNKAAS